MKTLHKLRKVNHTDCEIKCETSVEMEILLVEKGVDTVQDSVYLDKLVSKAKQNENQMMESTIICQPTDNFTVCICV